jgi:hypothetical protein
LKRRFVMKSSFVVAGVVTVIACAAVFAQRPALSPNLIIGTWKQNMEKSTYDPGPPPRGLGSVRQYAAGDDGVVVAITLNIDSRGIPSLGAVSAANYDGKEYAQHTVATLASSLGSHVAPPVTRTIAYKYIDQYTAEIVQRQDGQVVSVSTRTISRDGKTMTERFDYTDAQGQRVRNVLVFEKR